MIFRLKPPTKSRGPKSSIRRFGENEKPQRRRYLAITRFYAVAALVAG
jgi:hypothetical protein